MANPDIMVRPECRGHGVGRILASYVVAASRDASYRAVETYAIVETNLPSVRGIGTPPTYAVRGAIRHESSRGLGPPRPTHPVANLNS